MPHASPSCFESRRCGRVCLACHGQRLATLLETASTFRLYRIEAGTLSEEGAVAMPCEGLASLGLLLVRCNVALLICGGATCCCVQHVKGYGVTVVPWIVGTVPQVIEALRQNRLEALLALGAKSRLGRSRRRGCGKHFLEIKAS